MKPIFDFKLMKIIKQREMEYQEQYKKDVAKLDLAVSNLTERYEFISKQLEELVRNNASEEEIRKYSEAEKMGRRRLFVAKARRKYVRPNTWEDVRYRQHQESFFQTKVLGVIPNNLLLRFHGSPLWFSEEIIKNKKIVPSFDTYDMKTSADVEGRISVTKASNLNRWTTSIYAKLFEYKESLPAGCIFAVFPLSESELDDSKWAMNKVDFSEHPEQLYKIITTPENIGLVKKWCKESGLDTSYVCDYNRFIKILKKDSKKMKFGKSSGLLRPDTLEDRKVEVEESNMENRSANDYLGTVSSQTLNSGNTNYLGSVGGPQVVASSNNDYLGNVGSQQLNMDTSNYLGTAGNPTAFSSGSKNDDSQGMEYMPFDLNNLSKEQLHGLKEQIAQEYTEENKQGFSR